MQKRERERERTGRREDGKTGRNIWAKPPVFPSSPLPAPSFFLFPSSRLPDFL
jgi:hypothetical protein